MTCVLQRANNSHITHACNVQVSKFFLRFVDIRKIKKTRVFFSSTICRFAEVGKTSHCKIFIRRARRVHQQPSPPPPAGLFAIRPPPNSLLTPIATRSRAIVASGRVSRRVIGSRRAFITLIVCVRHVNNEQLFGLSVSVPNKPCRFLQQPPPSKFSVAFIRAGSAKSIRNQIFKFFAIADMPKVGDLKLHMPIFLIYAGTLVYEFHYDNLARLVPKSGGTIFETRWRFLTYWNFVSITIPHSFIHISYIFGHFQNQNPINLGPQIAVTLKTHAVMQLN